MKGHEFKSQELQEIKGVKYLRIGMGGGGGTTKLDFATKDTSYMMKKKVIKKNVFDDRIVLFFHKKYIF